MGLIDVFSENQCNIIDASTNEQYQLGGLLHTDFEAKPYNELCFLYLDNSIESIAVYLSGLNSGRKLVLLNQNIEATLKDNLENQYRPGSIYDPSRDIIEGFSITQARGPKFTHNYFISNSDVQVQIDPKIKVLLSTSGTTGSPKFVKLSEDNLWENAKSIAAYLPIVTEDVTPLNLPLYYSYGLSVLHTNLLKGGAIIGNLPDILQKEFWERAALYGFTSIAGVPYTYEMLVRVGFLRRNIETFRYISQAGGNLNVELKKKILEYCKERNIEFYVMYGQTEASARISYVPPSSLSEKIKSIGIPIRNGKLYLDSSTSELLYEGPNVFGGYCVERKDLANYNQELPLRTGDIAYQDEDGFFFIKGRMKRFIKLFGNRINLDEIERHLKTEFTEILFACQGIEDKFLLVAHDNLQLKIDDVKQFLQKRFQIHSRSLKFHFMRDIPLTSNGKINYTDILNDYEKE